MSQTLEDHLVRTVASLPNQPGVYLWKDRDGRVIYVGKAKRLRSRVRSYLTSDHSHSPKNRLLRRLIADVETVVVPSESQALLLENTLIKEHQPRFNITFRDDKSYPSIVVTLKEPFPRVLVGRNIRIPGARHFGPYTDVAVLRRTLQVVRRIFTVRSCHYRLPEETPDRPCLDYHIDKCRAPCVGYQSEEEYRSMIDDVVSFLEGKTVAVRTRLRQQMEEASRRLDFERAATVRDSLKWLDQLERPQSVELVGGGRADAVGYARDGDDAVGVVLSIRQGKLVSRSQRFLRNLSEEDDGAALSVFLIRHYRKLEDRAGKLLLPFEPHNLQEFQETLPETRIMVPRGGTMLRLANLADQNARHLLEGFRIESLDTQERAEDPVYALGRDLGLTVVPRSMICVDVSTNQGRDTVGSLVWFEAGRPKKSEYRRFRIKSEEAQQDDFAAVREIVTRYFERRLAEERSLPDLVLIDGGKGQLSTAREVLSGLGVEVPLASLAKREETVFMPEQPDGIRLPRRSESLRLLQRARDEAHRFAITYSRKKRSDRTITSELMQIPGVGPIRRRRLLEEFGSLAGVRLATVAEIEALPGFSRELAQRVLEHVGE